MAERDGSELGAKFRLDDAPALLTRTVRNTRVAVTQIKCDAPNHGTTEQIPHEDAFLVQLLVRDCPDHEVWVNGRPVQTTPFVAGFTSFYDLKRDPIAYLRSPFHGLFFYLPRGYCSMQLPTTTRVARIVDLDCAHGTCFDDLVVRNLGSTILAAFEVTLT